MSPRALAASIAVRHAPGPVVTVELDEVLGVKDVRVPLDERIWKRVRLVALN